MKLKFHSLHDIQVYVGKFQNERAKDSSYPEVTGIILHPQDYVDFMTEATYNMNPTPMLPIQQYYGLVIKIDPSVKEGEIEFILRSLD